MSDLEASADRVRIEALRGEATDAAIMRDYDRVASLFVQDSSSTSITARWWHGPRPGALAGRRQPG